MTLAPDLSELVTRAEAGDLAADRAVCVRAGAGCVDAQRAVVDHLLAAGFSVIGCVQAEILARLVAARGTQEDSRRLASIIWVLALESERAGEAEVARNAAMESLSMFRELADAGDGQALQALAAMGSQFPEALAAIDTAWPVADMPPPPPVIVNARAPGLSLANFIPPTKAERARRWLSERLWAVRFWWWDRQGEVRVWLHVRGWR